MGKRIASLPIPFRILAFLLLLVALWLPFAAPLYLSIADENTQTIVVMLALLLVFLGLLIAWSHWCYQSPLSWRAYGIYGLTNDRAQVTDLLQGLALGFAFTFSLFLLAMVCGWVLITPDPAKLSKALLEGSLTGLGVAFAEEIFFRGWLLRELDEGYPPKTALVSNGLVFSALHFLKPLSEIIRTLPQFPALALLGFSLVSIKRHHGDRLGSCIGLHGGLVWAYYIVNVGGLVSYPGSVPEWVTGIDRNPLSGVLGICFLLLLWFWVSRRTDLLSKKI